MNNSLIDKLTEEKVWKEFLEHKIENGLIYKKEKEYITNYILNKKYIKIVEKLSLQEYEFSLPVKHLINKMNTTKKRIVYTFNEDETMVFKVISYLLLQKYDSYFCNNCYSFRKNNSVKNAINTIIRTENFNEMYGFKIDIKNYFNSVNEERILNILKELFKDDYKLFGIFEEILLNKKVNFNNKIIQESKGIMAGVPVSSFLANVYLTDLDKYFEKEKILYARYSDDIILFCEKEKFELYVKILKSKVLEKGLELNEKKMEIIEPGSTWSFLGFEYRDNKVDISKITKQKLKGKIRRTARKIRRWMLRKNATSDRAIKAMIRKFNKKFYDVEENKDLTWSRWYFPIITTDEGIKEIDEYMQEYLRYIATGKHNKKNYQKMPYEKLKEYGYKPLVSEYWKYRKMQL